MLIHEVRWKDEAPAWAPAMELPSSDLPAPSFPRPAWRLRFRLWHVFFALLVVAGMLGAVQQVWVALWLWLPILLLGWSASRGWKGAPQLQVDRWWVAVPAVCLAIFLPTRFMLIEMQSWLILAGWCAWSVWFALRFCDARGWLGQALPMGLMLNCLAFAHSPWSTDRWSDILGITLIDLHGGRQGVEVLGLGLGWQGPETETIERLIGPTKPGWVRGGSLYPSPNSNALLQGGLGECLEMLPNDDVRRQVVRVLADDDNYMSLHQGLLLFCLHRLGYPRGLDAESWWEAHAPIFEMENDEARARWKVRAWHDRVKRSYRDDLVLASRRESVETSLWHPSSACPEGVGGPVDFGLPPAVVWWPAIVSADDD